MEVDEVIIRDATLRSTIPGRLRGASPLGRLARVLVPALFLSLLLAGPALGAGRSATLKAEEVVLDYEAQRLIATGQALLVYGDLTIAADRIELDLERNTLVATGHVVLTEKDRVLRATELTYDLESGDGGLLSFTGQIDQGNAKDPIFLSGGDLARTGEMVRVRDASLTTCALAEPHYHFTAGQVEFTPHDRLILRDVYYWEGHLRLIHLPYLAISLRERENGFSFPKFGYSMEEGLFLKLAYNFFVGESDYGALLLDLMQRKGIGEGIRYTWEFPRDMTLTGSVYHLGNRLTGGDDYQLKAGLTLPLENHRIRTDLAVLDQSWSDGNWARTYQLGAQILPEKGVGSQLTLNGLSFQSPARQSWNLDLAAVGTWRPWPAGQLTLAGRWYFLEDSVAGETRRENYDARLVHTMPWGRLSLSLRSQMSPGYMSRTLPQITLQVPRVHVGPILGDYRLTLDYQHREQETPAITASGDRLALDLERARQPLVTHGPFSLEAWAWAKVRVYDSGEAVWAAAPELTLVTRLGSSWRAEAGLSWSFAEGTPPPLFATDAVTPRGSLNLRATYRKNRWSGSIATAYALATETWQPVLMSLSWSSIDGDRLSFATSYNPQTMTFGLTTLALGWRPKRDWSFMLNAGYDPAADRWTQLDFMSALKQPLGDNLTLGLKTRYDFYREAWTQSLVSLDYRWHCRTVNLGYDWVRGEITLSISINAFPDYPVKLAYSESGLIFTPPVILP